ncbi:hypothetical protein [uncultured Helicobacter sp.]|uniref:hypothetical protein n=1 Tax=uncultured Helicobacter sp. TaxID=175537 RepID=UPI002621837B|nr:hypothetical protein [uncultured Helicobacter sp.]
MCTFEILNKNKSLNEYYKKSYYLKGNFTNDINCILKAEEIHLQNLSNDDHLKSLLQNLPQAENNIVLTYSNQH